MEARLSATPAAGVAARDAAPVPALDAPRRVPFNVIDELIHHLDVPDEPWTVQIEARVAGRLEPERLRAAIAAAVRRHPLARARRAPWQPWHTGYVWEIGSGLERDALGTVECDDDAMLACARARFYSQQIALTHAPPLRVQLARHPGGDVLMLSVHHSASDGLGSFRLLLSIVRAYAGGPDPVPDVDPLGVRDLRPPPGLDGLRLRARRVLAFLHEVRQVRARLAPDGGAPVPGFGFHTVRLGVEETAALAMHRETGATVNDVLLAGLTLAIARWNGEHGAPAGRIAIMMPVNLRPRDRWYEIVGNFSSFVTVSTVPEQRVTPAGTVAAVAARTRVLKRVGAAAALIEVLATQPVQPLGVKRTLWPLLAYTGARILDTVLLSNLGALGEAPSFGADGGRATELWFSPPVRMPIGLSVGAATMGGRLHLAFRYRHALFAPEAAARFAGCYVDALRSL